MQKVYWGGDELFSKVDLFRSLIVYRIHLNSSCEYNSCVSIMVVFQLLERLILGTQLFFFVTV